MVNLKNFPELNELVVCTAIKVLDHGAYFLLDEYNKIEAYMPIGEVSSTRAFDINEILKEGKKYICKVIRVDPSKNQVDISLKRVTQQERKEKLIQWKRFQRANKLIELVAEKSNFDKNKLRETLFSISDDPLSIFEKIMEQEDKALSNVNLPENVKKAIKEVAREHIKIQYAEASAEFTLSTTLPNGINIIKNTISETLKEISNIDGLISYRIITLGAPRFKFDLKAINYKIAEEAINNFEKYLQINSSKNNLDFTFKRVYSKK
jgi:translation initiation factor 2 subunit 1